MKIVVLVKQVPDTEDERKLDLTTGILDREAGESVADEINERALEVALAYKDSNKGTEVVVLSMGPDEAKKALRKGLQMGADSAVHVVDASLAGADAVQTATVLAVPSAIPDSTWWWLETNLPMAGAESFPRWFRAARAATAWLFE